MFRYSIIYTLLFACTFEEFSGGQDPTESYVITEGKVAETDPDNHNQSLSSAESSHHPILDLPEIGLSVFDVENLPQENSIQAVDELLVTEQRDELDVNSELMQRLRAERMQNVHTLGSVPSNLYEEAHRYHRLSMSLEEESKFFISDMMKSIITSVDEGANIIYIPLQEEGLPSISFEAIQYAQSYGVQFFDVEGQSIK